MDWTNVLISLSVMWKVMLGIFIVMVILLIIIKLMIKFLKLFQRAPRSHYSGMCFEAPFSFGYLLTTYFPLQSSSSEGF